MIRYGIIGAGNIAGKFATDVKVCNNAIVTAVASRSIDRAEAFAKKHDIEYSFGSYEELVKSDKIDAVYIATPHNFHKEQSILSMKHGKHVICEKPIAVNTKEFEEMVLVSKEQNVLLMEAMWTRFLPTTLKLREIIQNEMLGTIKSASLPFGIDASGFGDDTKRWINMNLAGGSILDLGVYPFGYTLNLTDEEPVFLDASATFHKNGADLSSKATLKYPSGLEIKVFTNFEKTLNNTAVIEFEKGTIKVKNFWSSESFTLNGKEFKYPHISDGFEYQIASFSNSIINGEKENSIMTHNETRRTMKLLDKMRKEIGLIYPFEIEGDL